MLISPAKKPNFKPMSFIELDLVDNQRVIVQVSTDGQCCIMSYAEDSIKMMCISDEFNPITLGTKSELFKKHRNLFQAIIQDVHTKMLHLIDDSLFQVRALMALINIQTTNSLSDKEVLETKYLQQAYEIANFQEEFVNDVYYKFARFLFPAPIETSIQNVH